MFLCFLVDSPKKINQDEESEREFQDEENNGTTKKVKKFVKEFSDALLKAYFGKTDLARTLCANGADPNACTEGKREPLDKEYLKSLNIVANVNMIVFGYG